MKAECTYLDQCPMFRLFNLESTKRFYVGLYCRGKFEECERRKLREKGVKVPDPLLPDGQTMPHDEEKPPA